MFLKKLVKLLIKKGKSTIAMKSLKKAVLVISMKRDKTPRELNTIMFQKLAPLVKIYKKKVAGKVYQLPWRTTKNRAAFQAAKWFMIAVQSEHKGDNLSKRLVKQFVRVLKDKGTALKLRGQFVSLIRENRSYMRFIRRKRFKKRRKFKGRFKNRFTKKSLSRYIFYKFYRKYSTQKKKTTKIRIKNQYNDKQYNKKSNTKSKK